MKQHKRKYNDEELYRLIMAELKPGAEEYDRMLSEGTAPAGRHRAHYLYKYVAAACIVFAIIGFSVQWLPNGIAEAPHAVSEVKEKQETHQSASVLLAKTDIKADAAEMPKPNKPATTHHTSKQPQQEANEGELEFLYSLITEVESRVQEEQEEDDRLYRTIVDEITSYMSDESNQSLLIL